MARLTSKDLAQAMGLKPGDKVKFDNGEIAKVTEDYELDFYPWKASLCVLVDEEIEISPRKKKIGEQLCIEIDCESCPLRAGYCGGLAHDSLYENLEQTFAEIEDKEIYNILKSRLDKEVNNENESKMDNTSSKCN